eukprot:13114454-Ditylum_brightwellii.AAC.1
MTQQEEEEEEGCPELINRRGNDEDLDEESDNGEEIEMKKMRRMQMKHCPWKGKEESLVEEIYDEKEEKEEGE